MKNLPTMQYLFKWGKNSFSMVNSKKINKLLITNIRQQCIDRILHASVPFSTNHITSCPLNINTSRGTLICEQRGTFTEQTCPWLNNIHPDMT